MKIVRLKTNRITNPLGFELGSPRLSWVVEDTESKHQKLAKVEIALDEAFENIIFESGEREDIDSLGFEPKLELQPRTRYFWRVSVLGDAGDSASASAWFETSKMGEEWSAPWIAATDLEEDEPPYLRGEFSLKGAVKRARAYAAGIGLYELEINGAKVGDEYLTPGYNDYSSWIQYQTYDITDLLMPGANAACAMLGQGWAGKLGFNQSNPHFYTTKLAFTCEIHVDYADGSHEVFTTGEDWKSTRSPIVEASIYDGEIFDANMVGKGCSGAGYDDSAWGGVKTIDLGLGALEPRLSLPIKIKQEIRPIEVIHTPKGETVLDMGQNMVGWLTFAAPTVPGLKIHLSFGEILQQDCFYRDNLRTAKCEYTYICDGSPAEARPYFTFYGFRYVKIEGWPGEPTCDDFVGRVLYSDYEETGSIKTSNPKLDRLFLNALWGQRGNYLDTPTDCPQRDERMGWTGDAQVFSGTACMNADVDAFFTKFMRDMWAEQLKLDGGVPHVVPDVIGAMGNDQVSIAAANAVAWADSATVIPWTVYTNYGDIRVLENCYKNMKAWVDWIRKTDKETGDTRLWHTGFHFGDWLALDNYTSPPPNPLGATDNTYLCSAYYRWSALLVAKAARALGKLDEAAEYEALAGEIKAAMLREFFTPSGRLAITTQTAAVVAIFTGLTDNSERTRDELVNLLLQNRYHLTTGFIGTPWLCRALSMAGASDVAYRLLMNEDYPSWLYEVNMGATTIWERWNSVLPDGSISDTGMNSLNHYSYGSIVEWMYRNMCGVQPDEAAPGYRHYFVKPEPCEVLDYARAEMDTACGKVASEWALKEGVLTIKGRVPFGATATLTLPGCSAELISGAKQVGADAVVELEAGEYEFTYTPSVEFKMAELPQIGW